MRRGRSAAASRVRPPVLPAVAERRPPPAYDVLDGRGVPSMAAASAALNRPDADRGRELVLVLARDVRSGCTTRSRTWSWVDDLVVAPLVHRLEVDVPPAEGSQPSLQNSHTDHGAPVGATLRIRGHARCPAGWRGRAGRRRTARPPAPTQLATVGEHRPQQRRPRAARRPARRRRRGRRASGASDSLGCRGRV